VPELAVGPVAWLGDAVVVMVELEVEVGVALVPTGEYDWPSVG